MQLIACRDCDRQYDVSDLAEGSFVRCTCGKRLPVMHHDPREPRRLRCPGCGAPLESGARSCSYCVVDIAPTEAKLTSLCPHCHARMSDEARFCMDCGKAISPQVLLPVLDERSCPRCQGQLASRRIENTSFIECSGCHGLWIPSETFDALCRTAETQGDLGTGLGARTSPAQASAASAQAFRYVRCLTCDDLMVPRNFGGNSGIIIDVCAKHGVWLDADELQGVTRYLASRRERRDGKTGAGLEPSAPERAAPKLDLPLERPRRNSSLFAGGISGVFEAILDLISDI